MTLVETVLIPMDLPSTPDRRSLSRSCVRVSSAFDAHLSGLDAGPVRKVVVELWARRDVPEWTDVDLVEDDGQVHVPVAWDGALVDAAPDERALRLLEVHLSVLSRVAERKGWDVHPLAAAHHAAATSGVRAVLQVEPVRHAEGRWSAVGSGFVLEDGVHLELAVLDEVDQRELASATTVVGGDRHVLRGLLREVAWTRDVVTVRPSPRLAGAYPVLPVIDMSSAGER